MSTLGAKNSSLNYEYAQYRLADGQEVSFQIQEYRLLAHEGAALAPEVATTHKLPPGIGEGNWHRHLYSKVARAAASGRVHRDNAWHAPVLGSYETALATAQAPC